MKRLYMEDIKTSFIPGILEKPQNYWPYPHLKLLGFLRVNPQKPQKFYEILNLEKPQNFWNVYPQPRKTSNFEDEVEDPWILRSRLAALVPTSSFTTLRSIVNTFYVFQNKGQFGHFLARKSGIKLFLFNVHTIFYIIYVQLLGPLPLHFSYVMTWKKSGF